jgi:4-amino-4-deoxy-L-arabinose transferase-like glycosyltransferase
MSPARRDVSLLLAAAALLFTANIHRLTLPAFDDCFYARKASEMAGRGLGMTVTWAGLPTFQNPPGQLWAMAASFRALGVNDAAARLPSALMALGALAATAWIGARLFSPAAGATGAALLSLSPFFLNNARRCMMEIPAMFWTTAALASLVAWRRRPVWILLFAPCLAMAILVKSVLGLLPLGIALAAALFLPAWRPLLRDARFWLASALGLALGASWPLHQFLHFGGGFLDAHFGHEIAGRSLRPLGFAARLAGYPVILLSQFQPVVLLAVPGVAALVRALRKDRGEPGAFLLVWIALPLALFSLSSAQSARYVFPLFPALALLGGYWLETRWPRFAGALRGVAVPALLVAGAIVFWVYPPLLSRAPNDPFRDRAAAIRARVPAGEPVPYWGGDYWRTANPLLWYDDRLLDHSAPTAAEALARAGASRGRLLMCDRSRLAGLPAALRDAPKLMVNEHVALLDLTGAIPDR